MTVANQLVAPPLMLLRGGHIYSPDDLGQQDILVGGSKILAIAPDLAFPSHRLLEEIDVSGYCVLPSFIDGHVHTLGGGGEGGPDTRCRDILLSSITTAGVTTVIGMIGFDCLTRSMDSLIAKSRALTNEGISSFVVTGGYEVPTPTLTGSIRQDIAFIEQVVGVGEIAISDHRSSQPTVTDLAKIAAEARIGGLVGKKSGVLVLHIGDGPGGIQPMLDLLENSEIPTSQVVPTHVNRSSFVLKQSQQFGSSGGVVDVTAGISPTLGFERAIKPSAAIRQLLDSGVDVSSITMTSDGNGNLPVRNEAGEVVGLLTQEVMHLFNETQDLINVEGVSIGHAIKPVTQNVARVYRLVNKGEIAPGKDADLMVAAPDLTIHQVYAGGRLMVEDGDAIVKGTYE